MCKIFQDISNEIGQKLEVLRERQKRNGEFVTLRRNYSEGRWTEWLTDVSSPFFTGDVLYCILESNSPVAQEIKNKSTSYFKEEMEPGGFWRFWPSLKRIVPTDTDDTALISFVLTKCGEDVSFNKDLIATNRDANGYFYTWFYPRWRNFYRPTLLRYYLREWLYFYRQIKYKWSFYNDKEAAVAAHVILYLGQNKKTMPCIEAIVRDGNKLGITGLHYKSNVASFYHVSKAYRHGVKAFAPLKETIVTFVKEQFSKANFLQQCMMVATLLNYGVCDKYVKQKITVLKENENGQTGIYPCFYNPPGTIEWTCAEYALAVYLEVLILYCQYE